MYNILHVIWIRCFSSHLSIRLLSILKWEVHPISSSDGEDRANFSSIDYSLYCGLCSMVCVRRSFVFVLVLGQTEFLL